MNMAQGHILGSFRETVRPYQVGASQLDGPLRTGLLAAHGKQMGNRQVDGVRPVPARQLTEQSFEAVAVAGSPGSLIVGVRVENLIEPLLAGVRHRQDHSPFITDLQLHEALSRIRQPMAAVGAGLQDRAGGAHQQNAVLPGQGASRRQPLRGIVVPGDDQCETPAAGRQLLQGLIERLSAREGGLTLS